jgi:hypothetical protein
MSRDISHSWPADRQRGRRRGSAPRAAGHRPPARARAHPRRHPAVLQSRRPSSGSPPPAGRNKAKEVPAFGAEKCAPLAARRPVRKLPVLAAPARPDPAVLCPRRDGHYGSSRCPWHLSGGTGRALRAIPQGTRPTSSARASSAIRLPSPRTAVRGSRFASTSAWSSCYGR